MAPLIEKIAEAEKLWDRLRDADTDLNQRLYRPLIREWAGRTVVPLGVANAVRDAIFGYLNFASKTQAEKALGLIPKMVEALAEDPDFRQEALRMIYEEGGKKLPRSSH